MGKKNRGLEVSGPSLAQGQRRATQNPVMNSIEGTKLTRNIGAYNKDSSKTSQQIVGQS